MSNTYYVYILSNKKNGVLYVGVTNNLIRRVFEHKRSFKEGFTKRYFIKNLMYYEVYSDIKDAIKREKQLKKWDRQRKIDLIQKSNSDRVDLYDSVLI